VSTPASALGLFIREQRQLARLSLRELSRMTSISNAYLSQVERGLHEPSLRVMRSVAEALGVPVEELYRRSAGDEAPAAAAERDNATSAVETAIRNEPRLSAGQKEALLAVFRGFLEAGPGG
jgi:transcriptional regulator with XRE-family HTH domain